jgi:hypothetical protein
MDLKETLNYNKPNLSYNTINTYIILLTNLYKSLDLNEPLNVDFFIKNYSHIFEFLKDKNLNSRKTILAAIITLLGNNSIVDLYRKKMMEDIYIKKKTDESQLMNEKEKENNLSQEEIKKVYNYYYKKYQNLELKKNNFGILNQNDYSTYQSFILLSLISGIFIPPRRLLDYTNLKFEDDGINNFYKKGTLYFKKYKTNKIYGEQIIKLPYKLNIIIKQFIFYRVYNKDYYKNDYFFITINNKELTPSQMNHYINNIFSNVLQKKINIGINGIRHSYLTAIYEHIPKFEKMKEIANNMGHSINQALLYIKK